MRLIDQAGLDRAKTMEQPDRVIAFGHHRAAYVIAMISDSK